VSFIGRALRDHFWQELQTRFGNRVALNGHPTRPMHRRKVACKLARFAETDRKQRAFGHDWIGVPLRARRAVTCPGKLCR